MQIERTVEGLTIVIHSEPEMDQFGRALAAVVRPGIVIGLVGTLGAGKTRLTRALAEALEVDPESIASPTYVLIHEYEGRIPIYHFDAYRLPGPDEFEALGASDYFTGEGVCVIEWANLVVDRLPQDTWWIQIEVTGAGQRQVKASFPSGSTTAATLVEQLQGV